ncbi:MAG: CDP-alcohol phosphatidyltransferase family protein [Polyangiaceae bacterium]|nr:CDP-alcohol phosphatidyltransferase family protein [Myxococcales bacterium]MCB9586371.1 CDP-alcohol phosphatidyltransferase family protein [Polyangiaceae bacterium]MCB9607047.1 CDP-alcohol phosphatidyltransferase family protein [Polyangiaceae bacterium]
MGFWAGYWSSLKSRDIEEPIDVWVHRPLAYLIARAAFPTPISPNFITLVSILFGIATGVCFLWPFAYHVQLGGVFLFWSAVWDCADGQLARMRGTASTFGRMLDGVADLVVSICGMGGAVVLMLQDYHDPWWYGVIVVVLGLLTIYTGSSHTATYDMYKNVFLRMTKPGYQEAEDWSAAKARHDADPPTGWVGRLAWYLYLFYLKEQRSRLVSFDPELANFSQFPPYSEELAARYRELALPMMRLWRGWFGFGSLVFAVSLFCWFDAVAVYIVLRLVGLNAFYFLYMRPRQRRLTRQLIELGVLPARAEAA